jgi:hypothetical protein
MQSVQDVSREFLGTPVPGAATYRRGQSQFVGRRIEEQHQRFTQPILVRRDIPLADRQRLARCRSADTIFDAEGHARDCDLVGCARRFCRECQHRAAENNAGARRDFSNVGCLLGRARDDD